MEKLIWADEFDYSGSVDPKNGRTNWAGMAVKRGGAILHLLAIQLHRSGRCFENHRPKRSIREQPLYQRPDPHLWKILFQIR